MSAVSAFGWLVLSMLLLGSLLDCALELLNARRFKARSGETPPELEGYLSSWTLESSVSYSSARARFSAASSLFDAIPWPALILCGLLEAWMRAVASLGQGFVVSGIIFVAGLAFARYLLGVPFSLYSTFVLERRYNFNLTTWSTWLSDQAKGLLLGGALFAIIGGGALLLIRLLPGSWWLAVWAFIFAAALFGAWIVPTVIAPLFNKFEPIPDQELGEAILSLLARAGVKVKAALRMDASKRTRHGNAFFTGLGSSRRIVFFDTLLDKLDPPELLAVAAHEAGHWRLGHIPKMLVAGQSLALGSCLAAFFLTKDCFILKAFGVPGVSPEMDMLASLALAFLAFDAFAWPLLPLLYALSRRFERQADAFAAELCGGGQDLARTLAKLSRDNLSNIHPHPLYVALKCGHPGLVERVAALRKLSSAQPSWQEAGPSGPEPSSAQE